MAAASDFPTVKKSLLKEAFVYVEQVRSVSYRREISFLIRMNKFLKMKNNSCYTNPLHYKDWILNVSKKRNAVKLILLTFGDGNYDVICRVRYSFSASENISVNKVADDKFVVDISSDIINVPGNLLVSRTDCLICELDVIATRNINIYRPVLENIIPGENKTSLEELQDHKEQAEEEALSQDLKDKVNFVKFSDFKVKTKDSFRFVHKSVIAARSKFFFDYLKNNPDSEEIKLDVSIEIFDLMLDYIYFGEVCPDDIPRTLALMKLAKKLQMKTLYEMCSNFVMYSIDASNGQLIREVAHSMGDDALISAADEILARKQKI